jgi:hypothetical protein
LAETTSRRKPIARSPRPRAIADATKDRAVQLTQDEVADRESTLAALIASVNDAADIDDPRL